MSKIADGGPAFPTCSDYTPEYGGSQGMTLRDYFAAHALSSEPASAGSPKDVSEWAYEIADAMIKARAK